MVVENENLFSTSSQMKSSQEASNPVKTLSLTLVRFEASSGNDRRLKHRIAEFYLYLAEDFTWSDSIALL